MYNKIILGKIKKTRESERIRKREREIRMKVGGRRLYGGNRKGKKMEGEGVECAVLVPNLKSQNKGPPYNFTSLPMFSYVFYISLHYPHFRLQLKLQL